MTGRWQVCPRCGGPVVIEPERPTDDRDGPDRGTFTEHARCLSAVCGWTS